MKGAEQHDHEFRLNHSVYYHRCCELGGVSKSMLTLNEAIIDVKKG
ncbi:hypothetical protein [Acinetobacter sp. YH12072]|nr:hypothetical protein [Acinetobacter sp. YH12072]